MGFKFKKSIKIAPGVKLNVGSKSVGVSVGVKGARYSVNSKTGAKATVSLPGTGISYSNSLNKKKGTSTSRSNYTSMNAEMKRLEKLKKQEENEKEVYIYEKMISSLMNMHLNCGKPIDWNSIQQSNPPYNFELGEKGENEKEALNSLINHKPNMSSRIFGLADKEKKKLNIELDNAIEKDKNEYLEWKKNIDIATNILAGNKATYGEVIVKYNRFDDFNNGSELYFDIIDDSGLLVDFGIKSHEVIPLEGKSLTKTGKVSCKKISKARFNEIKLYYVCSSILKIAGEIFNILPMDYVVINAIDTNINAGVEQDSNKVIASVKICRNIFSQLNLNEVNPVESMAYFEGNLEVKKNRELKEVSLH